MKIVRESLYEINQIPFSNANRNQPITQQYPMSRLQYEDADKKEDDEFTQEDYIECRACANSTHPREFKRGVCKKCAEAGFWADHFGRVRRMGADDRPHKSEEQIRKEYLGEKKKE